MAVTLGIIGCGYWGPNLVRNFHGLPGASVRTVSDIRPGRLEFIRSQYPEIATTDDYRDILRDSAIDAVAIVTPVTSHREIAEEAMRAGKDVFVEKPMAASSAEAWSMVELARQLGRTLAVGHIFQFAPGVRRVRDEIERGTLGRIDHISSTRINLGPPETTVDVVWDLAPHDLSIILDLLGEFPDEVTAIGRSFMWKGLVDNAHISLGFPSGATAHIHVSWLSSNKTRLTQVFGENGSIVYDEMLALDGKVKHYDRGIDNRIGAKANEVKQLGYSTGNIRVLELEQHEPLRMECQEFVRAVERSAGTSLRNSGEMGAKVVELLEKISSEIRSRAGVSA